MDNALMVQDQNGVALFQSMAVKSVNLRKKRTQKRDIRVREGKAGQTG